ncbi:MAG: sortase [Pseudomonadota bacterium]
MSLGRRAGALLGAALILAGTLGAVRAAHDPVKAWVGQILLERSWQQIRDGADPARPWHWADIAPIAKITVPRLRTSAVVLGSASGEAMAWGPGHLAGSAPLGQPGLAAIAGHRDSHLAFLADTRPGDRIVIETTDGALHHFEATEARVVDSRRWTLPIRRSGEVALALTTCWPFDGGNDGPLRFVLFAKAV